MKKLLALSLGVFITLMASSQVLADVNTLSTPLVVPSSVTAMLPCYDFYRIIGVSKTGGEVRNLQIFLSAEGSSISPDEYGNFGPSTIAALQAFQAKNKIATSGKLDRRTRAKLNSIYGCKAKSKLSYTIPILWNPSPYKDIIANIAVKSTALDNQGIGLTVCNNGLTDLPTVPIRIRLNGINRDFDFINAKKANTCATESIGYASWGLTYDPGVNFYATSIVDPLAFYKGGSLEYPLAGKANISVPAVQGAHLAVRNPLLRTNGVQATFCNLGTVSLNTFPVRITLSNSMATSTKNFDVAEVHAPGGCKAKIFTYDNFGITYTPNTTYSANFAVDADNTIQETNKFDNSASVIGIP